MRDATACGHLPHRPYRVAIVGTGFTGAAAAVALTEKLAPPAELILIDPSPDFGKGLAYGGAHHGELLNVRSRDASVFADCPNDFLDWLRSRSDVSANLPDELGDTFMPRAIYGDYVAERSRGRLARAPLAHRFVRDRVTSLSPSGDGGFAIHTKAEHLAVDSVVIATGYGLSDSQAHFGRAAFAPIDPSELAQCGRVVLVGTGLTMVDVLFRLRDMGYEGPIEMVSRRAILPAPHTERAVEAIPLSLGDGGNRPSAMLHAFRRLARQALREGKNWQGLMNGLRPVARETWQSLGTKDQATFLRHLKPFYFAHRHRLPPVSARRLASELSRADTRLLRAAVLEVGDGFVLLDDKRAGTSRRLPADLVIDCSGHQSSADTPLMKSLLETGLARRPRVGPGLDVTPDGRVLGPDGRPDSSLFALGPLGQGALLEITGIREIVDQSRAMATHITMVAVERRGAD